MECTDRSASLAVAFLVLCMLLYDNYYLGISLKGADKSYEICPRDFKVQMNFVLSPLPNTLLAHFLYYLLPCLISCS